MKVAVLTGQAAVRVVVVLRLRVAVEDVVIGVVVEFDELTLPAQHLTDDIEAGLDQHTPAFQHFLARGEHQLQLRRRKTGHQRIGQAGRACG